MRSVSVNNENFAQCAIKHKFQQHLQHSSGLLLEQITEYTTQLEEARDDECMPLINSQSKGPKVSLWEILKSIYLGRLYVVSKLILNLSSISFNSVLFY